MWWKVEGAPAGLDRHIGSAVGVLPGGVEATGQFPVAGVVAVRARCNCGWRAVVDCPALPDGQVRAEEIWRTDHMLPLCALGEEPASERIGRELLGQFGDFLHNLPFAEVTPLEGLRAAARVSQVAGQAIHELLAVALRQGLPLQQVADALGIDPEVVHESTGYPRHHEQG
ncbi:hypothetical protein OG455_27205 [Kitasatospora sp. NBC_01287]|uniref:hypothetical protein n=1 Tax=Kitasatospora sp. NBC_01287 TaxID=2903573 RepID=UPI00224DED10|nr:hypothetical protein [Kitasatospora sp. NBC_01287]MCX4749152.1 hypothetical protein [Kitasatospora sp. NBC_01287]